jgi:pimeloyl-ACP methyl ester carboxylesterase
MAARTQPEWQRWIYPELAARMKAAGDAKRLAELLQQVGPPPWADDSPQMAHLEHVGTPYLPRVPGHFAHLLILLGTPHWSLADIYAIPRGMNAMLHSALWKPGVRDGYLVGSNVFAVPVVVIQGGDDLTTPAVFTRRWLDRVQAPAKAYAVLPGQGHEALSFDNAAFTRALDATLLPILAAGARR